MQAPLNSIIASQVKQVNRRVAHIISMILLLTLCLLLVQSLDSFAGYTSAGEVAHKQVMKPIASLSEQASIQAAGRGNRWINFGDGRDVLTDYSGPEELCRLLEQEQAAPLSLSSADYDEDGLVDIVSSYTGSGEGIITLHRGNVDTIYVNSPEARQRKAEGTFTESPFLSPASVFGLPERADFLGAGDFDADGHRDIVAARRGGVNLYLMAGNGRGSFDLVKSIDLPGKVTAMVVGEINRRDGLDDIVVGINGPAGAEALAFEGPDGAFRARPEKIALPVEATSLALGQLNDEASLDLVVASGHTLLIIRGRDRKLSHSKSQRVAIPIPPIIESRVFSFIIKSLAVGDFDGTHQKSVAMLSTQGDVTLLGRGGQKNLRLRHWKSEIITTERWIGATGIFSARVSNSSADDLLIVDSGQRKMHFVTSRVSEEERAKTQSRIHGKVLSADVSSEPIAAIAVNLNGDAKSDVVLLRSGRATISVMLSAASSTITVNSSQDTNSRDGEMTLREAILISNGQLSANDLTTAERAQISGTPTAPGMDEIRFNILSRETSAQLMTVAEADSLLARAESGPSDFRKNFSIFPSIFGTSAATKMQSGSDVWVNLGPEGGHVADLVIDPSNGSTIYAGTTGGVFKSLNGGGSWNRINDGLIDKQVQALAIDPSNSEIVYAGTSGGVFKSTNGGRNWTPVNSGLSDTCAYTLAIAPSDSHIIYAGTGCGGGIYKSTNGGASWIAINSGLTNRIIQDLAVDRFNANTIYAATHGGVLRSTDGGANWVGASSGITDALVYALAIDPINTTTIYAGTTIKGVFKSTNGGGSWVPINRGLPNPWIIDLVVDPTNRNIVYAGTTGGVFRSANGGENWVVINSGLPDTFVRSLAINPTNNNTIYAGTETEGVYKSTSSGSTWIAASSGISSIYIDALAIDSNNPNIIYAGASGVSLFKSTNKGGEWIAANSGLPSGLVTALAISPTDNSILYAGDLNNGVFKSTNGGVSWVAVNAGLSNISVRTLDIDPTNGNTLFAGTGVGMFKSTNGGESWNNINSELIDNEDLLIDPTNSNTLYVGTFGGGMFKSTNGGGSWSNINNGLTNSRIRTLAIDPTNSNTLYVGTYGGGVFKSTNGGGHWNAINSGLTDVVVFTLAIDPINSNTVYAGTLDSGVFKSTNGGGSWATLGIGLSNGFINTLAVDPIDTSRVYAGTINGVFVIHSTGCTYTISPKTRSFPVNGGIGSVAVTTTDGCNWIATSNAAWITTSASGSGSGVANYTVDANAGSNLRTGNLTVAGQTFLITQSGTGSDCLVTPIGVGQAVNGLLTNTDCLSPFRARLADRYSFTGSIGQQVAVQLSSSDFDSYLHLVDSNGNIIAQDDDGAGSRNSRIPSVSGFFTLPTSGTFIVEVTSSFGNDTGNYTLSLTQGSGTDCSFSINPSSQNFEASGGNGNVAVTSSTGCAWTATSNAPFINISSGNTGSGNGTVSFNISANPSSGTRTGTITIAGQTFTVTQAGAQQCIYSITPQNQNFSVGGGDGNINVNAQAGCTWTAVSDAGFITVLSVTSGNGNGQVSYRVSANNSATPRSGTLTVAGLTFTVTQDGTAQRVPHTINLTSPLPKITDSVIIDGTTQPGTVIEINASGARGADVLSMTAGNSTVRGLVINHFNASNARVSGILLITNGNNVVEGCFIGTNAAGSSAAEGPIGNEALTTGISIRGSNNNRIGGLTTAARNVISGNDGNGIVISNGSTGNRIQGNYIGTDVTGGLSLGNQRIGIFIIESSGNIIGGTEPGAGNLISGNLNWGILVTDDASNNTIQGNMIGTNASGTGKIPNGNTGVFLKVGSGAAATNNTIGGTTPAARNIISGNDAYGVVVGEGVRSTQVQGNYIGTNTAGNGGLGNGHGVVITKANDTIIGGATESARNIISGNELVGISIGFLIDNRTGGTGSTIQNNFIGCDINGTALGNKQDGIFVEVNSSTHMISNNRIAFNGANGVRIPNITTNSGIPAVQIRMESNLIYNNAHLGIDLGELGVTENDPRDEDGGANLQQNFPVITTATVSSENITIKGKFNSTPSRRFRLQFFHSGSCGKCLGTDAICLLPLVIDTREVQTDVAGNHEFTLQFSLPPGRSGGVVYCTATSSEGNTSEISPSCVTLCTCTCPPTQYELSPQGTSVAVNYPMPSLAGNCNGATMSCSPPPTSRFPVGITPVNCITADLFGNTATCTFIVRVTTSPVPIIAAAEPKGKKLFITGEKFDSGAVILINGQRQKTSYESSTRLVGTKAGKKIRPRDKIRIRNSDGTDSDEFTYTP